MSDGSMKVTVYDLCVYSRHPPTATIFVSGVGSVELSVTEKVSMSTVSSSRFCLTQDTLLSKRQAFFP